MTQMLYQRGAALLAAMLTVTLVAAFAASALWQQWRTIEVEAAERTRIQAAWMLLGALDWSRLILAEDARGSGSDSLAEPWAVPLAEARLSTFLAAQNNVSQVEDASVDTTDAFLSGEITDLQSRLNLRNLLGAKPPSVAVLRPFERLFERLGVDQGQLTQLVAGLRSAHQGAGGDAPLLPVNVEQLGWLGLAPDVVARLAPYLVILPQPTKVNLNTASVDVLWAAVDGLSQADAQRLVQARQQRTFNTVAQAQEVLGNQAGQQMGDQVDTQTAFFEVRGRLRLDTTTVEERSVVQRRGSQVVVLWRQRSALPPKASFENAG